MADLKSKSLAEQNREFFDTHAHIFGDQEWIKTLSAQMTRFLQSNVDAFAIRKSSPGSDPVRLLDYACGYGVSSWALSPFVDVIRGIDVSDAMVQKFNESATRIGLSPEQAFATRGDLLADEGGELGTPEHYGFDAVIISMALHHVSDPQAMVTKLVERLKPGGVLIVVEGTRHDTVQEIFKSDLRREIAKTVNHHEFNRESLAAWLSKGGCSEDSFFYALNDEISHIPESVTGTPGGVDRRLFITSSLKSGIVE